MCFHQKRTWPRTNMACTCTFNPLQWIYNTWIHIVWYHSCTIARLQTYVYVVKVLWSLWIPVHVNQHTNITQIHYFQQCMMNNELETAASYLIILQNLERPIISRQVQTDKLNAITGNISSEALFRFKFTRFRKNIFFRIIIIANLLFLCERISSI